MGIIINVFRANGRDCTNNGISGKFDRLCVVNVEGPVDPDADAYPVILGDNGYGGPVLFPAVQVEDEWEKASGWFMFGGNFGYTSDSRFSRAVEQISPNFFGAVKIFDRQEN